MVVPPGHARAQPQRHNGDMTNAPTATVCKNILRTSLLDSRLPDRLETEMLYEHYPQYQDFLVAVDIADRPFRHAAVLIPIVDRPAGLSVLLTKRTDTLRSHAGQISFPGGAIDPEDVDAEAAALRETAEEVGIQGEEIEVIGYLPTFETFTGYSITPVVALVQADFTMEIEPAEVAEVFEVPLEYFMQRENREQGQREWGGRDVNYSLFRYDGHVIWGATSGLLTQLANKLGADHEEEML